MESNIKNQEGEIGGRAGKYALAVNIHFRDKSSSYTIYSVALQMKASGPALQSDQPCVSPLLPLAGKFSQHHSRVMHTTRHYGANNATRLCAQLADPASAVSTITLTRLVRGHLTRSFSLCVN